MSCVGGASRWHGSASRLVVGALVGLAAVPRASAHEAARADAPLTWPELARAWSFDPAVVAGLAISLGLYLAGYLRLRDVIHYGRAKLSRQALCFVAAWFTLVLALLSPLHAWGDALFSAHMVQHEILMLITAPLFVLAKPLAPLLWAPPRKWALAVGALPRSTSWKIAYRLGTNSVIAWLVHAVVLWVWHLPTFFQATLTSNLIHAAQHLSFLGSALLFWWALFLGHQRAGGYGVAIIYLFTTALHTGLLGALLSLAGAPWYPIYETTAPAWGLTALEDQQLGGLIMWIPAGIVYIVAALCLFAAWLGEAERRNRVRETHSNEVVVPPTPPTPASP